jgi:hypothetical protein
VNADDEDLKTDPKDEREADEHSSSSARSSVSITW